tara:strand:- start:2560 stop:3336 length:777 start_codon:yes stop_codon:yes gene_type:complete
MNGALPLFKSHYSIGKSILTLGALGSSDGVGPDSIIDICSEAKLDHLYLVEDSMTGFLEAYSNALEAGIDLRFGLRLTVCEDMTYKQKDYSSHESKCVIFCKNKKGYERLLKISSKASTDGFYYAPRIDYDSLWEYWDDNDLTFVVPFYDSFIHKNKLAMGNIIPDFHNFSPLFFLESNDLPFDRSLRKHVLNYCKDQYETQEVHSVYYKNKKDFPAYLTFRCISDSAPGRAKRTLAKPNFDHMCSNEFSFESWYEKI